MCRGSNISRTVSVADMSLTNQASPSSTDVKSYKPNLVRASSMLFYNMQKTRTDTFSRIQYVSFFAWTSWSVRNPVEKAEIRSLMWNLYRLG